MAGYLLPVKIWKGSSAHNPVLELFYYRGQYQLATEDAIYSDGSRYRPVKIGFRAILNTLPEVRSVLVLGAGLGSAVAVLEKMGYRPDVTLVDIDEVVLGWTRKLYTDDIRIHCVAGDAYEYISTTTTQFNVVVVDIFKGRNLPGYIDQPAFLEACRKLLTPGGSVIVNYMIPSQETWASFRDVFLTVFPNTRIFPLGINRILVARV